MEGKSTQRGILVDVIDRILIDQPTIEQRVKELGEQIPRITQANRHAGVYSQRRPDVSCDLVSTLQCL